MESTGRMAASMVEMILLVRGETEYWLSHRCPVSFHLPDNPGQIELRYVQFLNCFIHDAVLTAADSISYTLQTITSFTSSGVLSSACWRPFVNSLSLSQNPAILNNRWTQHARFEREGESWQRSGHRYGCGERYTGWGDCGSLDGDLNWKWY